MKTLFYLVIWVLVIISFWKIFEKTGKKGWESIIQIYNILMLLEIIGKPWWWILLLLIPGVNIIFGIWMFNLLSISFGKTEGFTVGLVLLPFVFLPILAFGDDQYRGPAGIK